MAETLFECAMQLVSKAEETSDPEIKRWCLNKAEIYLKKHAEAGESEKTQINVYSNEGIVATARNHMGNQDITKTKDTYNIDNKGQISSIGAGNTVQDNTFTQTINQVADNVDQTSLIREIENLLPKLKEIARESDNSDDYGAVAEASKALKMVQDGNKEEALNIITALKPRIENLISENKEPEIKKFYQNRDVITDLERTRIQPWQGSLHHEDFLIERNGINDIEQREILKYLERYGICQIRLQLQKLEEYVVESLYKLIGQPADRQNDFEGIIKDLLPVPGIEANTGSSAGDLGFHVDGTQTDLQPAILIFQYVATSPLGGNSRFADAAKVLFDLAPEQRDKILINLSRKDAATFSKKDMEITCPIFSFPDGHSLACRIRYDSVLTIHPECEEDFRVFEEAFNNPKYHMLFKPRPGDIIIFDNWRVMHARDEIYSLEQRHHRRVWLNYLRQELQSRVNLGIRPVSDAVKAQIKEMNGV